MENLYNTLKDKQESIKAMDNDYVKGDYNLVFLGSFIPRIINHSIDGLKLEDIKNYDNLDSIPVSYKIYFLYGFDTDPRMSIDEDTIFFHLSSKRCDVLCNKILSFFGAKAIANIEKDISNDRIKSITINTTLKHLITRYGIELNNLDKLKNGTSEQIDKLTNTINTFNEVIASDIHANLFEEAFLDGHIVNIIKRHISSLTQRNLAERTRQNMPINWEIMISPVPTNNPEKIYVPNNLLDEFLNEVKSFLESYNLGTLALGWNFNSIRLSTNLYDLMDAYYMEKQRIEHYTSGDYLLTTDPNAKKLVKNQA